MKKRYLFLLFSGLPLLTGCFQPTIRESPAGTELAGIYEKTDVAATEQAKVTATPIPTPTPIGKSSGKILHTTGKDDEKSGEDIFITDIDTLEKIQLTNNSSENTFYYFPIASHSGEKIAYALSKDTGATYNNEPFWKSEILIMDINGDNQEKISNIQMYVGQTPIFDYIFELYPSWSPDDKKLAFTSNRAALVENLDFDLEIFVIDLEKYSIQQLTKAKGHSEHPSWSPDGEYIIFMSDRDGDWDIYYMNSDGTGQDIKITNNTATDRYPSWSNVGNRIIYHSDRDGNLNLYIYDMETEEEIRLTNHPSDEFTADWSPDDSWIVYGSDRDGDHEIYIMNVNTKEEMKISDNQVVDGYQNWIP